MKAHPPLAVAAILTGVLTTSCMLNTAPAPAPERTSVETIYTPGYTVAALPSAHSVITRGGTRYYVVDGTYYRATQGGYMVVPRPL